MKHNRPQSRSLKELGIDVEAISKEKRGKYLVEHPKGTIEQDILDFFSKETQKTIKKVL